LENAEPMTKLVSIVPRNLGVTDVVLGDRFQCLSRDLKHFVPTVCTEQFRFVPRKCIPPRRIDRVTNTDFQKPHRAHFSNQRCPKVTRFLERHGCHHVGRKRRVRHHLTYRVLKVGLKPLDGISGLHGGRLGYAAGGTDLDRRVWQEKSEVSKKSAVGSCQNDLAHCATHKSQIANQNFLPELPIAL